MPDIVKIFLGEHGAYYAVSVLIPILLHMIITPIYIDIDRARTSPLAFKPIKHRRDPWYRTPSSVGNKLRERWHYRASLHILLCTVSFSMLLNIAITNTSTTSLFSTYNRYGSFVQYKFEFIFFSVSSLLILIVLQGILRQYHYSNGLFPYKKEKVLRRISGATLLFPIMFHYLFRLPWITQ